jgi:hypothetical protein
LLLAPEVQAIIGDGSILGMLVGANIGHARFEIEEGVL